MEHVNASVNKANHSALMKAFCDFFCFRAIYENRTLLRASIKSLLTSTCISLRFFPEGARTRSPGSPEERMCGIASLHSRRSLIHSY